MLVACTNLEHLSAFVTHGVVHRELTEWNALLAWRVDKATWLASDAEERLENVGVQNATLVLGTAVAHKVNNEVMR